MVSTSKIFHLEIYVGYITYSFHYCIIPVRDELYLFICVSYDPKVQKMKKSTMVVANFKKLR